MRSFGSYFGGGVSLRRAVAPFRHWFVLSCSLVLLPAMARTDCVCRHFAPPVGGAELIDPKMRNSHEFPKCTASCFDIGGGTLL